MSIKSLNGSTIKSATSNSESFDLNFKQIEQTNKILNNIEGKLNSFFKKKKKTDSSLESSHVFKSQKHSPIKLQDNFGDSMIKNTNSKKTLFSNALINESLSNKYDEKDDLQETEKKIQEDLGSLKERLNSIQTKIPMSLEENKSAETFNDRSFKLQSFKEKNEAISSNFFQEKVKLLEEKVDILNKEIGAMKDDKTHLINENEKFKEMLALMNKNHSEDMRRAQNQNNDLINQVENLKSENTLLQMKMAESESNCNIMKEELTSLEKKYKSSLNAATNEQIIAEKTAKSLQDELKSLESKYKSALTISSSEPIVREQNINEDLFRTLNTYQEEIERIKTNNRGISEHFKNEVGKLQTELQMQKSENENIKEELNNIKKNKTEIGKLKDFNEYTQNLEKNYNELESQHKQQIEKNNELKQLLDKLSSKNKEDFKNFNQLYHEIYGKTENPLKKEEKEENSSFLNLNERRNSKNVVRGREKSKKETLKNKSLSKRSNVKNEENSSDKENRLDKCHQEIKRLKDLVNEKITMKKKEKPKKKKKQI